MAETKKETAKSASVPESNILGALSYLWILSVILYVLKKDDQFVQFHAKQGMVIFVLSLLGVFPVLGWPLGVIAFILVIVGAVKAYQGEKFKIPVVADIADKIKF